MKTYRHHKLFKRDLKRMTEAGYRIEAQSGSFDLSLAARVSGNVNTGVTVTSVNGALLERWRSVTP